ncbi:nucleoside triphosphate pyrophosphohydrolase [Terrihalobacillus insolitus]|uniref:nucleoside triphosphate pyrophosphohydrolase n=1 Tax=Terrihalobacillus insolitus TaxID=2950438 RepID=UPI0023419588|nr:nucleoside triphosphate pyrophosphohydrolase [Terrihalobacillus insolitus]MDC3414861.1 nucleoside triphosphate pyrophosphohydrolase [Terrihalobacillus insolitus]
MKPTINVIGLGAGDIDQLPLGLYRKMREYQGKLFVRTLDHPVIQSLQAEGVEFQSFDSVYEKNEHFEAVYREITNLLLEYARTENNILYAVPGHPMLAEKTVQLLLEHEQIEVNIYGGQSYLDDLFSSLKIDPIDGFQFLDATSFIRNQVDYRHHIIFCQVYDAFIASEVKLVLLEDLPPDHPVTIVEAVGSKEEKLVTIPLEELDHKTHMSNLTSVYVPPINASRLNHQFFRLREVIAQLRGPDGCPWDKKQTHESLRRYLIEEAYEFIDAVNRQDDENMIEELGDILLQVMLHSQIGEDAGLFTIDDVLLSITDKMIRRHPHVFADTSAQTTEEVMKNWDQIKREEKGEQSSSLLDQVPDSLPGLLKAEELQKTARKVGFDWDDPTFVWNKINEEIDEVKEAIANNDPTKLEEEFGDLFFTIVNLARHYKINPELAIETTNRKFTSRFRYIEEEVQKLGTSMEELSLETLEAYWQEAKNV